MEHCLQFFRDYPFVGGVGFFLVDSLLLAIVLGVMMRNSSASLRPLVFFFGFVTIVGGPQAAVHLLDAYLTAKSAPKLESIAEEGGDRSVLPASATSPVPVPWRVVFRPQADPDLVTDAKRGLGAVFASASEVKLSFNASGESALAARFATSADVAARSMHTAACSSSVTSPAAMRWAGRRGAITVRASGTTSWLPATNSMPGPD